MVAPLSVKIQALQLLEEEQRDTTGGKAEVGWLEWTWYSLVRLARYVFSLRRRLSLGGVGGVKKIEGIYGSGMGAYFRFLRLLILVNTVTALISIAFVTVPQVFDRLFQNVSFVGYGALNMTAEDFFTGKGWLGQTELFYGSYTDGAIFAFAYEGYPLLAIPYDMTSAYFYTVFVLYFFVLACISISMARSFRRNFVAGQGDTFCESVFGGWDFAVTQKRAASFKMKTVSTQLKESVEYKEEKSKEKGGLWERFKNEGSLRVALCVNASVMLISVGMIVGGGYLAAFLMEEFEDAVSEMFTLVDRVAITTMHLSF